MKLSKAASLAIILSLQLLVDGEPPSDPFQGKEFSGKENFEHLINSYITASGLAYPIKTIEYPHETYDYIVVGAGSAGCVVASRLTETNTSTVLVIETGEPEYNAPQSGSPELYWRSKIVFYYDGVPQKYGAQAMRNKAVPIPVGRGIGGGSAHNAMYYNRGNREDYDNWARLGAKGWSYSEVFPYFIRSERVVSKGVAIFEPDYHGYDGPLLVSGTPFTTYTGSRVWKGIDQLGLPKGDYNGRRSAVFNYVEATADERGRASTGRTYLGPASFRANLDIIVKATVVKVLIDSNKKAYGVVYVKNGKEKIVKAKKEVILSAGAFNTPKLLMLSGIGPKKELQDLGIEVIVDLPGVGKNFQYHPNSEVRYSIKNVSNPTSINFIGNFKSKFAPDPRPDIEYELFSSHLGAYYDYDLAGWILGYGKKLTKQYLDPHTFEPGFFFIALSLRCFSRGEVKLRSRDPFDQPIIDHKVYSDERDLKTVVEGLKIANKLAETPALRVELQAKPYQNTIPGCEKLEINSDEFFECLVRSITFDAYHPCCTAKIGSKSDIMAVVDPYLRVYGVKNLRVIDASVIPEIPSGNINAPVIMIAEKASDLIKMSRDSEKD